MIRVHIQPAGIHDAWIELKEADGHWFLNFAKDKHDFHRDPGHIWAGIPVAPHVAESLVRQAQAIVKRKDPHVSLTILDGAVITVSLADGPVEQRHHFNIPQPGKPEATFLRELLALAASSIEAPAFVDYHEWLEQALFQASPVRVRTEPPYTVDPERAAEQQRGTRGLASI